jgi:hypothetical protein
MTKLTVNEGHILTNVGLHLLQTHFSSRGQNRKTQIIKIQDDLSLDLYIIFVTICIAMPLLVRPRNQHPRLTILLLNII